MKKNEIRKAFEAHGLQAYIARKCSVNKATVSLIFSGKRRATAQQARDMEAAFARKGIPLDHWDLLYGVKAEEGQTLEAYLDAKLRGEE